MSAINLEHAARFLKQRAMEKQHLANCAGAAKKRQLTALLDEQADLLRNLAEAAMIASGGRWP